MGSRFPGDNVLRNLGLPLNYVPRPRAPPRLIRPPSPLYMERPQPIVPDVSLIIDSATTSFHSNAGSTLNEGNNRQTGNIAQNEFALPRTRSNNISRPENNSQNSPHANFLNYYPTPPQNLGSGSNEVETSSGNNCNNASAEELLSHSRASRDDTSASENLPLDENISGKSERSCSSGYESLKEDLASVMKTVRFQADCISKINSQLQKIAAFQDKFLVHIVKKGSSVSKYVQTDDNEFKQSDSVNNRRKGSSPEIPNMGQCEKNVNLQGRRSAINSDAVASQSNPKRVSPNLRQELLKNKVAVSSATVPEDKKSGGEDLSAILRSLQISNVQHPSTYSDTSMKSIEFPPFNDDTFQNENSSYIGPSASAQGSDLDDDSAETIFPSVTYYNNLLSTVNRILDGGEDPNLNKPVSPQGYNEEVRPSSASSAKRQNVITRKDGMSSSGASNSSLGTASYSSTTSLARTKENAREERNEFKENFPPVVGTNDANSRVNKYLEQQRSVSSNADPSENNVVESTKKYLQSLGVQFDTPTHPPQPSPPLSQKQNYMIQQNVYNSIYIPTVNCVPVISESVNSSSGLMDNLARKYIPSEERMHYDMMAGKSKEPGTPAETTVYGMTPGNLSFATKEYLKRYGLVGQTEQAPAPVSRNPSQPHHEVYPRTAATASADKVLDITAIRNQPKLL